MLITVRVHPRASRARREWKEGTLDLWVTAPPVDGRANQAVIEAVAKDLGVPVSSVRLHAGARSRIKTVEVLD